MVAGAYLPRMEMGGPQMLSLRVGGEHGMEAGRYDNRVGGLDSAQGRSAEGRRMRCAICDCRLVCGLWFGTPFGSRRSRWAPPHETSAPCPTRSMTTCRSSGQSTPFATAARSIIAHHPHAACLQRSGRRPPRHSVADPKLHRCGTRTSPCTATLPRAASLPHCAVCRTASRCWQALAAFRQL